MDEKEYLKNKVKDDQNFLLERGLEKARKKGLELKIGEDLLTLTKSEGKIHIPILEDDRVDVKRIVALVADDYPKITERYLSNKEKLKSYQ